MRFQNNYKEQRNKGVRQYQHVVNYFLALDHERGKGYDKLAQEYNLDRFNIRHRIRAWNKKYYLR